LDYEKQANACTEIAGLAIQAGEDEDAGLAEGEDDGEELLGGLIELPIGLEVKVDIDEVGASKELRVISSRTPSSSF
jgi:hypothetical protein